MTNLPAVLQPKAGELRLPTRQIRVLGIDLGTTNSTMAEVYYDPEELGFNSPNCLEVEQPTAFEGNYTNVLVPSVVAIYRSNIWVGEGAKRLRGRAPELGLKKNATLFYDCKNEMGIEKTYHKAPTGFRSAREITGQVLRFLYQAALADDNTPSTRSVITVPASFQANQRRDTLIAAELAGINVLGGDLLDEPVAAFLDYLVTHSQDILPQIKEPKTLLVFDFGGGTCDVAIFRIGLARDTEPLYVSPLAVSRYHRLGGGDIDAAILYEILVPQILEQNNLSAFDLSFDEKRNGLAPCYLSMAEALKISLCTEISRLMQFGKYDQADKSQVASRQPGVHSCTLRDRTLTLNSPRLTAQEFEKLLESFLDRDFLFARETEYRLTCSIFAPLQDALDRANLDVSQIDLCLLVGGSCLIPQVVSTLKEFFSKAKILTYRDSEAVQTAVAKGASCHALALALFGKGLVQPVCQDRVAIRTKSGPVELIPKGAGLPYPSEGYKRYTLVVPETSLGKGVQIRVEISAGEEDRLLFQEVWDIPFIVNRGDPVNLEYRYNENQVLDFHLELANQPEAPTFQGAITNPLSNVVNPTTLRLEIEELEEAIRTGRITGGKVLETMVVLADRYAELNQREKSLEYLKRAMRAKNKPDVEILNKMASLYGEIGDHQKEEKCYREAADIFGWSGAWFNLSLSQRRQGRYLEAQESIDQALRHDQCPPYYIQKALIAESLDDKDERRICLERGMVRFGVISGLNDWELGWFLTGAEMAGDREKAEAAKQERQRRAKGGVVEVPLPGILPGLPQGLTKVDK